MKSVKRRKMKKEYKVMKAQYESMIEALETIEKWNLPRVESHGSMIPYHQAWGSNGEREYIRGIARGSLLKIKRS